MNLIRLSTLLLAILLIACGGEEKNASTAATTSVEKMTTLAKENASQMKKGMQETMADAKADMGDKDMMAAAKEKMAETATAVTTATKAPIEKMAGKAKDAVNISMDDAKNKGKQMVESAKEKAQTVTNTAAKKAENVSIKGAEKITEATKSTAPKTTPKIVEKAKEEVVEKTAAVTAAAATAAAAATKTATAAKEKAMPKKATTVDHSSWDKLLRKHVTSAGKVNYKAIKADEASLDAYLKLLSTNPIIKAWSRNEKMAYWINAYNAYTVKLIVDNYPVKSILDLHGGKAWDHSWIKLGDKTYTLNDIEHKILRPQFKDPRIHFAVNCAATSCPPILNRAWTAGNLNKTLELQTKKFINDASYNTIGGEVAVSKIFEWYKEDFGELSAYLNKYAASPIAAGTSINFKEYDWALNKQ